MHKPHLWGNAPGNNPSPHLCSVDPFSMSALGALALGGLGAAGASVAGGGGGSAPPDPAAPPPQAPPSKAPLPKQNTQSAGSSFLGTVPAPPQSTGSKSLLGQ